MYNRFIVNKDIDFNSLFERINFFQNNGFKQIYHLIVKNTKNEELVKLFDHPKFNNFIRLYNNIISIDEQTKVSEISSLDYIESFYGCEDKVLLNHIYDQMIEGYSAIYPSSNFLVNLDNNFNMTFKHNNEFIGNLLEDIKVPKLKNVFIGNKRKCSKCLNCLCDYTKTKGAFFLIDDKECDYKLKVKEELIDEEVKKVTKEEYNKIMESISEVYRGLNINDNLILEILSKKSGD